VPLRANKLIFTEYEHVHIIRLEGMDSFVARVVSEGVNDEDKDDICITPNYNSFSISGGGFDYSNLFVSSSLIF